MPEVDSQVGGTVQYLGAAAGAGQIAVAPHTGEAVIRQLTKVQDEVARLRLHVREAAADPRFGGGYAEQISRFIQGVAAGAAGSAEEVLTKYWDELEQLKAAVAKSIDTYQATDEGSAHGIASAGEPL